MKARIHADWTTDNGFRKPVSEIANEAAEALRHFILTNPAVIHDVTDVGDVTRSVKRYELRLVVKDRHDLAR